MLFCNARKVWCPHTHLHRVTRTPPLLTGQVGYKHAPHLQEDVFPSLRTSPVGVGAAASYRPLTRTAARRGQAVPLAPGWDRGPCVLYPELPATHVSWRVGRCGSLTCPDGTGHCQAIFSFVTNALSDRCECAILHAFCAPVLILLAIVIQAFAEGWLCEHPHIYGCCGLCFLLTEQKAGNMFFLVMIFWSWGFSGNSKNSSSAKEGVCFI